MCSKREKEIQELAIESYIKLEKQIKKHAKLISNSMEQSYYMDNLMNRLQITMGIDRGLRE